MLKQLRIYISQQNEKKMAYFKDEVLKEKSKEMSAL